MKKLLVMGCIVIMSMFAGDIVAQNTAKREKKVRMEQTCRAKCPQTKTECCEPKAKEFCVRDQQCCVQSQECPNTKLNCKANTKCPQVVEKKTVKMRK